MPLKTKMLEVVLDSNQETEVVLNSDHEQDKNLLYDSTNCHSAEGSELNGWFASNDKLFSYSHMSVPLTINLSFNDWTEECSYFFYF